MDGTIYETSSPEQLSFLPVEGGEKPDQKVPPNKAVPVVEIFGPTIEGEGRLIGAQTMFIRFGLCDYKCKKCDSMHAVDPGLVKLGARWQTQEEIDFALHNFTASRQARHIRNVTFSGGNPAIHELGGLVDALHRRGKNIFVETQGTKTPEWMTRVQHIVVSPKSPGMGEKFDAGVFDTFMRYYLSHEVPMSVKIVVFSAQDLEFAAAVADICRTYTLEYEFNLEQNFYLSLGNPMPPTFRAMAMDDGQQVVAYETPDEKALVGELLSHYNQMSEELMKDHRLSFARLLPQLHVLVWGNETGR